MADLRITVLVDDTVNKRDLFAEHGLSVYVELGNRKILFDTGQTTLLIENSRKLGIDLKTADAVILSHGHYDHTGGLADVLTLSPDAKVYAHQGAFAPKYTRKSDGTSHYGGMPQSCRDAVKRKGELVNVTGPVEICDGFYLTGPIPRVNDFEDTGGPFFRDEACTAPDDLIDDQAAFIVNDSGVTVVLGCAHSGVINTLNYIEKLTEYSPINAIIGGMHLVSAGEERLDQTIAALNEMCVEHFMPSHCTGIHGITRLWQDFPHKCSACNVGTVIVER